jgi:TonB-linked SusC/RagA family outer membrane protein
MNRHLGKQGYNQIFCFFLWSLLTIGQLPVMAQMLAQNTHRTVIYQSESYRLVDVIQQLKERYHVNILFEESFLKSLSVPAEAARPQATLEASLQTLLQPFGLQYRKVKNNYVILSNDANKKRHATSTGMDQPDISPATVPALDQLGGVQPQVVLTAQIALADITITGTVTDEKNEAMPGVSVVVKGTQRGTTTDSNGQYKLSIPGRNDGANTVTLVFSFVGYVSQEVLTGNQTMIAIRMVTNNKSLDEVVVVGYGTKKRENVTGAIAQVSSEALTSRPITKLGQALQGLIPNLNVTNPDGNPNASPTFNVRGNTSLSGGSALVLVDGIQMDMNLLNPADVETITVLKDAASAAIYGARGAFGVILVTTKKGSKDKKPVISYTGSLQFNRPTYLPDLVSTQEYLESQNVAQLNLNGTQKYTDDQLKWVKDYSSDPVNNPSYHMLPNGKIFWNATNNVVEALVKLRAPGQTHTLNINGGNAKTSYYVSAGSLKQDGLFKTATDVFKRYNFTTSVSTELTSWLTVGAKANYISTTYDEPHKYPNKGSDWWEQMTRGEPQVLFPARTPANSPVGEGTATENFVNFLESGSRKVNNSSTGVYAVNADAYVTDGLKISGNFAYTSMRQDIKETQVAFPYIRDTWIPQISGTSPSFVQRDFTSSGYFAGNLFADYKVSIKQDHLISALIGYNQEWYNLTTASVKKQDLISESAPVLNLATGIITTSDLQTAWAIRGVFARFNYDYRSKYLIELNSRYDGTSRFPTGRRFGYFPSVSIGWRITKEKFMEPLSRGLKDLKLRASYGSLGNQLLANNFPSISLFGINLQVPFIIGGALPSGIQAPGLVSPDLTWEKVSTLDFGADANLWGKLNVGFDWYRRITSGMLVAGDRLPAVLGTAAPQRNGAELKTTGFELSLKWSDQVGSTHPLRYDFGIVLSNYQAVISKFDNNPNLLINNYYVGQKVGEIWGFESSGLFQANGEVPTAANQDQLGNSGKWGAGDVHYADLNGDKIITRGANTVNNPGDQRIIGNTTPKYQYGITGNLTWHNFNLNLLLQGVGKRDFVPQGNYFWGAINGGGAVGTKEVYRNSWSSANPDAYYPIYRSGSTYNILPQTHYLQSSAYVRLKNISLGYSIPQTLLQKIKLSQARIYVTGQNVWEWTKLKGNFDPEVTGTGDVGVFYPLQRVVSFGVQLSL